jgi:hypothetical protein
MRKRPDTGALPNCIRLYLQATTLVGRTYRTLLELAIGIARGFIASGISRTRSMCRSVRLQIVWDNLRCLERRLWLVWV